MDIYTKRGDDGTTGLFYGGRVSKADAGPEAYGTVDEAVAALGVARTSADDDVAEVILERQREMFVVAAELATSSANRRKLSDGTSRVTPDMTTRLEELIDDIVARVGMPREFVVPGGTPTAAALDVARTVVRRAERRTVALVGLGGMEGTEVVRYLNRLADYLYMLAREVEGSWIPSRRSED